MTVTSVERIDVRRLENMRSAGGAGRGATARFAAVSALMLLLAAAGVARADGDAARGEKRFDECATCHSLKEGVNGVGPSLHAVLGRKAGSLTWAGLLNTYYWIDPTKRVAAVFMTQVLPFADRPVLSLYRQFERGIYGAVNAG